MRNLFTVVPLIFMMALNAISQVNTIKYQYNAAGNRVARTAEVAVTSAKWVSTGSTRCVKDSNNINTGLIESQEQDSNPSSITYNQLRWVNSGFNMAACPVTYYSNTANNKVFIKNNCGTGYMGSNVTYTVPAGRYASTISQADANQRAQADLDSNGQDYTNANGSCLVATSITLKLSSNFTGSNPECKIQLIQNGTLIHSFNFPATNSTVSKTIAAGSYQLRFVGLYGVAFQNAYISFISNPDPPTLDDDWSTGWWDKLPSKTELITSVISFAPGKTYKITATDAIM